MTSVKQQTLIKIVKGFCAAWDDMDLETIMSLMSKDAVYDNLPLKELRGCDQIRGFIGGFFQITESAKFDILNIVAEDNRVVTDRVDSFVFNEGRIEELPVLGIFEFDADEKISHWREYWDLQMWIDKGGPALS
jgi:limonene-1,2-epoxide hydrolase